MLIFILISRITIQYICRLIYANTQFMNSLISPDNHLVLFFIITGAAAFGIYSEHKKWFGKLSGILVTMISMSILSMTGVVPVAARTRLAYNGPLSGVRPATGNCA